jgi:DNA-binding beta-propeller fold protein YncE
VLPGITPLDALPSTIVGGWQVIAIASGSASGTVAVLSTYDQLLLLVDVNTWTVTKSIPLSGTPFRIVADTTNGAVIVAFADPVNVKTTYASVDVASGTVTPLRRQLRWNEDLFVPAEPVGCRADRSVAST